MNGKIEIYTINAILNIKENSNKKETNIINNLLAKDDNSYNDENGSIEFEESIDELLNNIRK